MIMVAEETIEGRTPAGLCVAAFNLIFHSCSWRLQLQAFACLPSLKMFGRYVIKLTLTGLGYQRYLIALFTFSLIRMLHVRLLSINTAPLYSHTVAMRVGFLCQ